MHFLAVSILKYSGNHICEKIFIIFLVVCVCITINCAAWGKDTIENTLITLNVTNESIDKVFEKIEKQTTYKLVTKEKIKRLITIRLKDFPLDKGINRILSGLNYSVLCDDGEKIITIKVVQGGRQAIVPGRVVEQQNDSKGKIDSSMSGVSVAIASYRAGEVSPLPEESSSVPSSMSGASAAIASYRAGEVSPLPEEPSSVPSSMSGASAAIEDYKAGEVSPLPEESSSAASSMFGASAAIEDYKRGESLK